MKRGRNSSTFDCWVSSSGMGNYQQYKGETMKTLCLVAVLVGAVHLAGCRRSEAKHAPWDGTRFTCPTGTDMWVSESESLAGREDAAYCIPTKPPKPAKKKKQRKVSSLLSQREYLKAYEPDGYEDMDDLGYSTLDDLEERM